MKLAAAIKILVATMNNVPDAKIMYEDGIIMYSDAIILYDDGIYNIADGIIL